MKNAPDLAHRIFPMVEKGRIGFRTTNESKKEMAETFIHHINSDSIRFAQTTTTSCPSDISPESQIKLFFRQCSMYSKRPNADGSRVIYSGKDGMEQDDLCIAVQLAMLSRKVFLGNPSQYGGLFRWTVY